MALAYLPRVVSPFISAITVVYGGVAWLEQAVDFFLHQDYDGPKELVIVNSFPQQTLFGTSTDVRIINLNYRPGSLGELRNLAIKEAKGDIVVTWDSDDVFLPHHLSTFAEHFEGNEWVWLNSQFWILGESIQSIVRGACPLFAFTRAAWADVGGYPSLTVGEDAGLIGKITSKFKGKRVDIEPDQITFGYRWGQGSHHVSGEGADQPGKITAHARAANALQDRIRRGLEKTGQIDLHPNNPIDWVWLANSFITAQKKRAEESGIAFVELGRFGDICNILPLLKHCAEKYAKPSLVVSREFAPLLEGLSYVTPFTVDLQNNEILKALKIAERNFRTVINCQIWGQNYEITKVCASYNRESWRLAGFEHKFEDRSWKPVFDRRNAEREAALWQKLDNGKPMLLANLTKSVSSPFAGQKILDLLHTWFDSRLNVVDVSSLILPQIYDLIGLMERAAALVSIDTALIHFAAATDIPVVVLVNPLPWQGTEPRCNWISKMTYTEAAAQPAAVRSAVIQALKRERVEVSAPIIRRPPIRTIAHVVERHSESGPKDIARKLFAQRSWDTLYANGVLPCHLWNYPRNALEIGDVRALPYLKDVLKFGMDQVGDDDIVMWTNDDNVLHPDLPEAVRMHVGLFEVCTSQRCEFHYFDMPPLSKPASAFAKAGEMHIGRDLFAATKGWLVRHWEELPDFILGASDFDLALACMVRLEFGIITTRKNIETSMYPAEMTRGYIEHQYHPPKWFEPHNVNDAPSQKHNRRLFREYCRTRLPDLKFGHNDVI